MVTKIEKFLIFKIAEKSKIDAGIDFIRVSPLLDILKTRANLKVLDLGCRLPQFLWLCYHIYSCQKVVGVEIKTEQEVIDELLHIMKTNNPANYEKFSLLNSIHEWYLCDVKPDTDELPLIQSKDEYDYTFDVHFETDIVETGRF